MGQQKNRRSKTLRPGRLRIVAGQWRSRLLAVADESALRPTPERIRETLFNWLSPNIEGKRCLDLFAGSGALGFEALSRGAASSTFVERSKKSAELLRQNVALLQASGATVHEEDAFEFLSGKNDVTYDIVFLDPPFADDRLEDLCRLLVGSGKLASAARIYLEREQGQALPVLPDGWVLIKEKAAGNVSYALVSTCPD